MASTVFFSSTVQYSTVLFCTALYCTHAVLRTVQSVSEGNKEDVLLALDLLAAAFSSPDGVLSVNTTVGDRFLLSQSISRTLFLSYNDAYMWSQFANALVVDRQVCTFHVHYTVHT